MSNLVKNSNNIGKSNLGRVESLLARVNFAQNCIAEVFYAAKMDSKSKSFAKEFLNTGYSAIQLLDMFDGCNEAHIKCLDAIDLYMIQAIGFLKRNGCHACR